MLTTSTAGEELNTPGFPISLYLRLWVVLMELDEFTGDAMLRSVMRNSHLQPTNQRSS
jgi:hypothetical protein